MIGSRAAHALLRNMVDATDNQKPSYRFGRYLLNTERRTLYRDGEPLEAAEKAIQLLLELLRHPGQVVGKYDLIDQLWPEQDVSEWSLSRLVSDTRHLLGESAEDNGLIQTVRGKGFRLDPGVSVTIVEASATAAPAVVKKSLVPQRVLIVMAAIAGLALVGWLLTDRADEGMGSYKSQKSKLHCERWIRSVISPARAMKTLSSKFASRSAVTNSSPSSYR